MEPTPPRVPRRDLVLDGLVAFWAMLLVPLIIAIVDGPFSFGEWYGGLLPWSWAAFTVLYFLAIRASLAASQHIAWQLLTGMTVSIFGTGIVVASFFGSKGILTWSETWFLVPIVWILAAPSIAVVLAWIAVRSRARSRAPREPPHA